ncbi:ribbon-helix-helix protein, CopG family [Candidatus Soleaferrea massiliensis]|uniref:ribbon-helix-helix protein, CopG family n=1 Tax=Candidatus Soleaferrea massiliensis TaxID=1470354 RepID=UPI00058C0A54|nr:ribbon-helix-helix protein, CopG family [Candidatus Soleaferrea massiliensis]
MAQFIPKPYKKEPITFRIDIEKLRRVEQLANEYDMSRSEFINQCINFALEHMPKEKNAEN